MRILMCFRLPARLLVVYSLLTAFAMGQAAGPVTGFVARDGMIQVLRDGEATPVFVHAVNLGVGIPGKQPGELAVSREQYDRWFARMASMGFNALRTYTLHYPRFYQALRDYNVAHPEAPLYLLHGIWLDEENPDPYAPDLHYLTEIFDRGIVECVSAVHGDIEIGHRFGRAYGTFDADISPWVMGWIIGREIYPDEVEVTNVRHPEDTAYVGTHVSLGSGSPTEYWLAERVDLVARYEDEHYASGRPISVSSWPTLDPLRHPTESQWSYEDTHSFDLADLDTTQFPPGYFASFHAYPYYPDWMSEDPAYVNYVDAEGPNSYLGYLVALRNHYYPKPLIIAEFGVPSSWGNAHVAQSGMHHGGHDEVAQGHYAVRMFDNMAEAGCAGGALFAWIDEWWKNTWITEFLEFPLLSRPIWLNVTAPEQNFGLIAFDEAPPIFEPVPFTGEGSTIRGLRWAATHRFFHLEIDTDTQRWPLVIGFDTYGDDVGETVLPGGTVTTARSEFALVIDPGSAQLYVTQAYDLFGIWHDRWGYITNEFQLYHSIATDGAPWSPVRWLSNRRHASDDWVYVFPETIDEIGRLRVSPVREFVSSMDAIAVGDGVVKVRMPWTLLQFTNPTQAVVMDDDRGTPQRETAVSDGIRLVVAHGGGQVRTERLIWDTWDLPPPTTEREKASVAIIERYLRTIGTVDALSLWIVSRTAETVTLDWTQGGVLEVGETASGPWHDTGLTAPATVVVEPANLKLFRVRRSSGG
jgi:hypothetical protein